VDLGRNLGVVADLNSALTRASAAVVDATGSASVRLGAHDGYERLAEVIDTFNRSLQRATSAGRFEEVAASATAVWQEASRFAGWVATALDERLRTRISGFTARALRVSIGSGAAGLLAVYLFVGFYLSVARPIRRIVDTLDAVAHGDLTRRASVDTRDELAFVAHALNDTIARTEAATNRLSIRATHDALTGLPNRAHVLSRLRAVLDRSVSTGELVCVIFVDLDRFKIVNDSLGHDAGDQVLRAVTARITALKRPGDTVARLAGDEFVVICEGLTSVDGAVGIAERIVERVAQPISVHIGTTMREATVGASVGIALTDGITHAEPDDLMHAADVAMYQAKQRGRGRVEIFDDRLRAAVQERADAHHDLRRAVDAGEIHAHYQPFVAVATGRVVGVEASARWHHPRRGVLDTGDFITIAEEDGLVGPIGAVILRQACRQAAEWRVIHTDLHVAIKVSGTHLADPTFVGTLSAALSETGLDTQALWLAVTETSLGAGADATRQTLDELRDLGVRIVIDDFGTGYSSLVQLPRLPVDAVKVDRTFVTGIGRPDDEIVIAMIVALCRTLGLFVVADGVETDEQLQRVRELGCDAIQGPWSGRPTPADRIQFGEPVATH
jgi:diguanylate cyclase (GGDEF)-like protein